MIPQKPGDGSIFLNRSHPEKNRTVPMFFILVALCFLVYANSLTGAFICDDLTVIVRNPSVGKLDLFSPPALLDSLNYRVGKLNTFGYHLANVILHSLNSILVFIFLGIFFKTEAAFLGAGLFAAHPIHSEAISWVSGKPYLIIGLFILVAYLLYYYSSYPQDKESRLKPGLYLASLALFSYFIVNSFSFFALVPLFIIFSDVTFQRWRRNWKLWLPFLFIAGLRIFFARNMIGSQIAAVARNTGFSSQAWANPLYNLAYSLFTHLRLLLWPARLTLYHEPMVISSWAIKTEVAVLVLIVLLLPVLYRKARMLFYAMGLFVLFLAPTYSPRPVCWLIAERYAYFPSVALSIVLAFCYERAVSAGQRKIPALIIAGLVIAACGIRAVIRNEDWKTQGRFWRQTLKVSPQSPKAHNNMGDVYYQEGDIDSAIREFKKAIEIRPDFADAYFNLGNIYYYIKGDAREAVRNLQLAINYNPGLAVSLSPELSRLVAEEVSGR
ncbi:MAG: tetratricopeptide repeat protein [Candidatus Omnitrophota bacterium]|nr:tetratricopeptide repeat protein [Candidatus Omnitrophota bacterium]